MANTRQKLMGGAALGIAALAFYLGTLFNGFGLGGSGTGTGTAASGTGEGEAPAATATAGPELAGDESVSIAGGTTRPAPESLRLTVVMSGKDYLITASDDPMKAEEADIVSVAEAALAAKGDPQGIRVRVYHRKDATAGVLDDLKRKFEQVGIPAEAVQYMEQPID